MKFREEEPLTQGHTASWGWKQNKYNTVEEMDSTNIFRRMKTNFVPFCFLPWGWGVLGARTQLSFLAALLCSNQIW